MYSGMSSVPMISSGSKSRLKEERWRGGKARDRMRKQGVNQGETHSRIVRFFEVQLSWGCLPLSMALGFFSSGNRGGDEKRWMSVRVDLQGISADYFIDRGSALGVMTGQRALLEYQAAGFSSRMRRVFV
jgi:hypothetical protein